VSMAGGNFLIDANGNITCNNGTFNNVTLNNVTANNGSFSGDIYASGGFRTNCIQFIKNDAQKQDYYVGEFSRSYSVVYVRYIADPIHEFIYSDKTLTLRYNDNPVIGQRFVICNRSNSWTHDEGDSEYSYTSEYGFYLSIQDKNGRAITSIKYGSKVEIVYTGTAWLVF